MVDIDTSVIEKKLQSVIALLARIYVHEGNTKAVTVLAHSKIEMDHTDYDNWNGISSYGFTVTLEVPFHLYKQIEKEQNELEEDFKKRSNPLLKRYPEVYFSSFVIAPVITDLIGWQDKAKTWLSGNNINNQGRVRSDNIASRSFDGLLFRSKPEILIYQALKSSGLSFAPLPVFIKGGSDYRRIEPDFVIINNGIIVVLEVDGDTVHHETPAEAHNRITMLNHEGAHIERVKSSDCDTPEKAEKTVNKVIEVIKKLSSIK